jgi:hypothetical protein
MRIILAAIAVLCAASLAWAQDLMSPAQFQELYTQRVVGAAPGTAVTPLGALSLRITPPSGDEDNGLTVNLDRAYAEYSAGPDDVETILDRWVRFATQPIENAQMPERIVSVLRTRSHVDGYTRAMSGDGQALRLVWRPFAGDLVEMIAFDSAEAIQFGTEDTLSDIGLSAEQAWALAPQNLPARLGALEHAVLAPGVTWVGGGNGLAPSVLTNAGWCGAPENANALYLIVDRDSFLMAERPTGVDAIRRVRDGMLRDGNAFSATLLACEGGRLQAQTN